LLLDEPTAGMNPQETRQAEELIFKIRDQGLTVVVIEHDTRFIFNLCDRVLCLVQGKALIEGTPAELEQGQVVTLVGTNGAGKTTTLRTMSGLIRPESGEIWFEGARIDAARHMRS
jgi:ABC-type branched-subunit amino acid transport system ATPase component